MFWKPVTVSVDSAAAFAPNTQTIIIADLSPWSIECQSVDSDPLFPLLLIALVSEQEVQINELFQNKSDFVVKMYL